MSEFTAPSGARIVINTAPWESAKNLKKTIERALVSAGQPIGDLQTFVLRTILLVDSSDEVEAALWPCLARCLRDEQKIVPSTFDKPEARQDYYDIVTACVKENLGPLAESLRSKLSEYGLMTQAKNESPKSTSPTNAPSSASS